MHWRENDQYYHCKHILGINLYEENMFKCTDPLNLPRGIAFWLVWDFEFEMSTGVNAPLRLACVGERVSGQAGKRTGEFILYVFSLFDVVLVYSHILFVFFCTCGIIWFVCNDWEFCFVLRFFFVLCLLILVFVLGSSSWGDKFIFVTIFWVLFYDLFHKRALCVLICVYMCVCVCVWCRTAKPAQY